MGTGYMSGKNKTVPERFTPQWLQSLDGRTAIAQEMRRRFDEVATDLGGADRLSYLERSLVSRYLWAEFWIQQQEREIAEGRELDVKLGFLDFARPRFISALHGTGVGRLLEEVAQVYRAAHKTLPTPQLNRILAEATEAHQPPLIRGRRIKLRYAHQGGRNPPAIIVHGNQTTALPSAYRRYLVNRFRRELGLWGTPIRLELRTGENPFAGRRNKLTPRQQRKRERVIKRRRHGG